jgi:hypothetical protein
MSYSSAYQPMVVNRMTRPEPSNVPTNPIPAADMIHETLRCWRGEEAQRGQTWWRRMWRWIFSA